MYLIVCLGNPGPKYQNTRHNIGFQIASAFTKTYHFEKKGLKFKSILYQGIINSKKIFLIKPQTFMNLSGQAVNLVINFFKIPKENILCVYDDIDIPFGIIKIRPKGSAGTHNGLKSVISEIGYSTFPRIKFGIGPKPDTIPLNNYVLSNFSKQEEKTLQALITKTSTIIHTIFQKNLEFAMNEFNRT